MEYKRLTADRFVDTRTGCSYRYVRSETEFFRPHDHDYYELFLTLSGTVPHMVNGREQLLAAGTLVLIRPSDRHSYCPHGQPFSFVNLSFLRELFDQVESYCGDGFPAALLRAAENPPTVSLSGASFQRLKERMETLCTLSDDGIPQLRFRMRTLLFDILTHNFGTYTDPDLPPVPEWLANARTQMEQNRRFAGGMEQMTALTGKSREHLARSIRKYYHQSASEFINELRLNYFANMLRNSDYPILELCYDSGFQNVSWAYELFRRKYGCSPRQYRDGSVTTDGWGG